MLTLPIKKKWFDMIVSGEKKEEYREIKAYWTKRFHKYFHDKKGLLVPKIVKFRNGYSNNSPTIQCKIWLKRGKGKEEWGAEPGKEYYILKILNFKEETKNE